MWTFKIPPIFIREKPFGNSLAVQWLGRHAFTAEGMGLIPDQETKISQGVQCSQKKKKKKFNILGTSKNNGSSQDLPQLLRSSEIIWLECKYFHDVTGTFLGNPEIL